MRVELVALRWGGASWLGVCGHTPASPVLALEGEPGGVNGSSAQSGSACFVLRGCGRSSRLRIRERRRRQATPPESQTPSGVLREGLAE